MTGRLLTCPVCGAEGHSTSGTRRGPLCDTVDEQLARFGRAAYEAGARIGVSAAFCYDPARAPDVDATVESIMRRYDAERSGR